MEGCTARLGCYTCVHGGLCNVAMFRWVGYKVYLGRCLEMGRVETGRAVVVFKCL